MAAVSTRVSSLLLVAVAAFQLLAPMVSANSEANNFYEVPVHHGGSRDHRDMQELRQRALHSPIQYPSQYLDRQDYGAPAPPAYQGQEEGASEFLPYFLPILALTGLSLLFPNVVTINASGRRRRDLEGSAAPTPMDDLTEHLTNIYYAATESDECIQRIVCELGATTKSLKQDNKKLMISILGKAASNKYSKLFSRFQDGVNTADCKKIGCKLLD